MALGDFGDGKCGHHHPTAAVVLPRSKADTGRHHLGSIERLAPMGAWFGVGTGGYLSSRAAPEPRKVYERSLMWQTGLENRPSSSYGEHRTTHV